MNDIYEERDWVDTTAAFAPAVLGAAAGILFSEAMSDKARRPIGLSLACIGLAALTPMLVETAVKKVKGPGTRRGSLRTLRGIRDHGLQAREISYVEDELGEELGVG
ncbi:MAG: hypothetical protein ACJAT6_000449 [Akkermansiaceae bacterium]|jgi:hypothetical protein|nr:hypothetical protein [Akkermansiaceae bacterium]|tara:strand:- start:1462 stop:1782 length:321 start_codon:yes stop_codon:yes gene_type:complete